MPLETPRGTACVSSWDEIQASDWLPYDKFSHANVVEKLLPGDIVSCQIDDRATGSARQGKVFYGVVGKEPGPGAYRFADSPDEERSALVVGSGFAEFFLRKVRKVASVSETSLIPSVCRLSIEDCHNILPVLVEKLGMKCSHLAGKPSAPKHCAYPYDLTRLFEDDPELTHSQRQKALDNLIYSNWDVRWKLHVLVPKDYRRKHYAHLLPEFLAERATETTRVLVSTKESSDELEFLRTREPASIGNLNWIRSERVLSYGEQSDKVYPVGFVLREAGVSSDDMDDSVVWSKPIFRRDPGDDRVVEERKRSINTSNGTLELFEQKRIFQESEDAFLVSKFLEHFHWKPDSFSRPRVPVQTPFVELRRIIARERNVSKTSATQKDVFRPCKRIKLNE